MRHFSLFDSLTLNIIFRLRFTVQGGEAWVLTKKDISSSISKLGVKVLDVNFSSSYKTTGLLLFDDKDAAKSVDNTVVEVKGCLVHLHVSFNDLPPFPSDHQILIESQSLPITWERATIVRKFFETFGEVTGILSMKRRLVVSFKNSIAATLTGRLLQVEVGHHEKRIFYLERLLKIKTQVPWASTAVFVREVSCLTIPPTSTTIKKLPIIAKPSLTEGSTIGPSFTKPCNF